MVRACSQNLKSALPIGAGGHAVLLAEFFIKIGQVWHPTLLGDRVDWHGGLREPLRRPFEAQFIHNFGRRLSEMFPADAGNVVGTTSRKTNEFGCAHS